MLPEFIVEPKVRLFRYDLSKPPVKWSAEHKNPEYVYLDIGLKNKVGASFFFMSEVQAVKTAKAALKRYPNRHFDGVWITSTQVIEPVRLLDLRIFSHCSGLLATLFSNGLDVLTSDFRRYGKDDSSFVLMRDDINAIISISKEDPNWFLVEAKHKVINETIKKIESIIGLPNDCVGGLCQQFTDFNNGEPFKNLLQNKGYKGYIFNEANHQAGTDTVCLFDMENLKSPCTSELRI